jgi:hypothetical protein
MERGRDKSRHTDDHHRQEGHRDHGLAGNKSRGRTWRRERGGSPSQPPTMNDLYRQIALLSKHVESVAQRNEKLAREIQSLSRGRG